MLFDYLPKPTIPLNKAKKKDIENINTISFIPMELNLNKTSLNENLFFKDDVSSLEKGI
jgi:hypothetical protein